MRSPIPRFLLTLILGGYPWLHSAAAAPFTWEAFTRSSTAHFLFRGTTEGSLLFERITDLTPRQAGDLGLLATVLEDARFNDALRAELEARLERVRARFEHGAGNMRRDWLTPKLSVDDQRALLKLASEELTLAPGNQIEFVKAAFPSRSAGSGTFAAKDAAFREATVAPALDAQWADAIAPRVAELERAWPAQMRVVDDVGFRMPHPTAPAQGRRRVLVISQPALDDARRNDLRQGVLRALGRDTVSFPIKEKGRHLYVRIGEHVLDFAQSVERSAYALSASERIEPVLALSPAESARLARYADRAASDPGVVGRFGINGVVSGETEGQLHANRGVRALHNCVSWICTAPIGERGAPLLALAGAKAEWQVHTNPGWWTNFLVAGAEPSRIPLVLYWTNEPLEAALTRIRPGADFIPWDFARRAILIPSQP